MNGWLFAGISLLPGALILYANDLPGRSGFQRSVFDLSVPLVLRPSERFFFGLGPCVAYEVNSPSGGQGDSWARVTPGVQMSFGGRF